MRVGPGPRGPERVSAVRVRDPLFRVSPLSLFSVRFRSLAVGPCPHVGTVRDPYRRFSSWSSWVINYG